MSKRIFISLAIVMSLFASGCASRVPKNVLQLTPETLGNRQLQTRHFRTGHVKAVMTAANAVLQDLGFSFDETSVELGVLVGSKKRDATDTGQVVMLALLGALTNPSVMNHADATQIVKVSLVVRELDSQDEAQVALSSEQLSVIRKNVYSALYNSFDNAFSEEARGRIATQLAEDTAERLEKDFESVLTVDDIPGETSVRVTFQHVVLNRLGLVNSQKQITDIAIYKEFFEKLSKSLFLEANQI